MGSCEWYLDQDDSYTITTSDGDNTYKFLFEVQLNSEFNWYTHAYCGQVSDSVCITVPSNFLQGALKFGNIWYYSSDGGHYFNYLGGITQYERTSPGSTYCSYSPAIGMIGSDYMGVDTWVEFIDGKLSADGWNQSLHPVDFW